ncbi:hypothetical protein BKA70DRAFT_53161 [Coprinopsis sp. MPI-PUGE-AT-0042]|nr:hypothetical protein BKA70DRAFT_53161 [Coprinopsis sp. MPI-PUGE-AT-0042]
MPRNPPAIQEPSDPLPVESVHPLDLAGITQTNGSCHFYDEENNWRDLILTHWDIRRFDVCTLQGDKIYSVKTPEDLDVSPYTTLNRRKRTIATYDWKGLKHPTRVLCPLWTKRKKKPQDWMFAANYVKGRLRNNFCSSSSDAVHHTVRTSHDCEKYVWQSTKDRCVLYHVKAPRDLPDFVSECPLIANEFPTIASVHGPELITTGPIKGTMKRVLRYNEINPLNLDMIMSTFLTVDDKRVRKYLPDIWTSDIPSTTCIST